MEDSRIADYYYTTDHEDSVREVCNSSGTILTRYTYDPFGRTTTNHLSGSVDATYQYAGLYAHSTSGLQLAVFRAYDPTTGRWINRDPIEEAGGLNLYEYCSDDPDDQTDTIGLLDTGRNTAPPTKPPPAAPPRPIPKVIPRGPLPPGAMWARGGLWGIAAGLAIYDGYEGYQIYSMNQASPVKLSSPTSNSTAKRPAHLVPLSRLTRDVVEVFSLSKSGSNVGHG